MITVTAFKSVPPFAQGLVRDLRVRWALEEAGLRYEAKLLGDGDKDSPEYRAWQPFGQVPAYEENGLKLFESGAIVLRIAERSENLLPGDPAARARAIEWLFAALNTSRASRSRTSQQSTFSTPIRNGRSFAAPTLRRRLRSASPSWRRRSATKTMSTAPASRSAT